ASGGLDFFVESAFGLVAEHLALQHFLEKLRQLEVRALVFNVFEQVAHYGTQNIQTHEIDSAEGGRLGPATGAGERVDFLYAEIHLLHQAENVQAGKCANAVSDEVGRVLGVDNSLAHAHITEMRNGLDCGGIGFRGGNDLQQAHVTRRVEEMGAEPVPAEIV